MSLAAFSAIVFAVAGTVSLVSFLFCVRKVLQVMDFKESDGENSKRVDDMFDKSKWYVRFTERLIEPSAYIAIAGLLVAIVASVIGA